MAELKLRHNLKFGKISLFDLKVGQKQLLTAETCHNGVEVRSDGAILMMYQYLILILIDFVNLFKK